MEKPNQKGISHHDRLDAKGADKRYNDRKEELFNALNSLVKEELAKNPDFNITSEFVEEKMKLNPELFGGIKSFVTLIRYFSYDINFLRVKLGLPRLKTKRY